MDAQRKSTGERRQLTVLFCDIVDSTVLSDQCDLEDLREALLEFQTLCTRSVEAWSGKVVNYIGDGIRAEFGYPLASENEAESAVRAGLDLLRAVEELSARAERTLGQPIKVRIGIHTGFALIGKGAADHVHGATEIVGDTPNIAARLQEIGTPNSIVISGETEQLLRGRFELRPLGTRLLRGLRRDFRLFEVLGEAAEEDARRRARRHIAPLVDRTAELAQLLDAWELAKSGQAQAVELSGDSGIGKSRLALELIERTGLAQDAILALQASAYHQNVPLYPITQLLEQRIGMKRDRSIDANLAQLRMFLSSRLAAPREEPEWLIGQLLGLAMPTPPGLVGLDAQELRRRTLEQLVLLLMWRPHVSPGLILVEDLHWADASTRETIDRIVGKLPGSRLMLLITSRPEPARADGPLRRIVLQRLGDDDCFQLASLVAHGRGMPNPLLRSIVARSDGVPLFIEELAVAALETGRVGAERAPASGADAGDVPAALYDPLMMRLDRLGDAKRIAQLAAVIGRSFSRRLLAASAGADETALDASLARLLDSGLIEVVRADGDVAYAFRHTLVRDVAYYSLLKRPRRDLHAQIAATIESTFPALADAEPDYLAQHLSEAGEHARALPMWIKAAKRSAERSANHEALAQLRAALQQLEALPPGTERDSLELELQVALIGPAIATQGYAGPFVEKAMGRALELCRSFPDDPRVFPALYSQWMYNQVTGKIRESRKLAQDFLTVAERKGARAALMVAHRALGTSLLLTGETDSAHAHLERAITLYDENVDRPMAVVYGSDVRVLGLCHFAIACWQRGEVARALSNGKMALDLAFELRHANTIGAAFTHVCMLYALERDVALVKTWVERGLAFALERELPFWITVARGFLGWCELQSGRAAEGMASFERQYDFFRALSLVYWMPTYLCWWSEACLAEGRLADARARLAEARQIILSGGECWYEPECLRVEGLIAAHDESNDAARARDCFEHALLLARERGQLGFALRAALDLARLLARAGDVDPARSLVEEAMRPFLGQPEHGDRSDAAAFLRALNEADGRRPRAASGE